MNSSSGQRGTARASESLSARDRLIVALDVSSTREAQRIVQAVGESAGLFKVGLQLFSAEGPHIVREIAGSGRRVFLDLKFHDIPNTVAAAVREAAALQASMITVHASGGAKMLRAAAEAAAGSEHRPIVLAVTVLTSLGNEDLDETGVPGGAANQVLRLAALAQMAGCDGVVASAHEAPQIRKMLGRELVIVTAGIRPTSANPEASGGQTWGTHKDDQARAATPAEAIAAGANYIVVGRPITAANDPAEAARSIREEIERALAKNLVG